MKLSVLIAALVLSCAVFASGEGETPEGFLDRYPLLRSLADAVDFPWARPLLDADMDLIEDLLETGFLSDTEADWYVPLPDESDE